MAFRLRYQLAGALVGLNIIGTAALATFAYQASRDSLERQATRAVDVVADERDRALGQLLSRQQQRLNAFLASVESLCGERSAKGSFGWEPECVRVALTGFETAERAAAADLTYNNRVLAGGGSWPDAAPTLPAGQLAAISRAGRTGDYTMEAARGRLALRARFPLDDVEAIFQDRSGLEGGGEVFLTDVDGRLLTPARYPVSSTARVLGAALQPCLAGTGGQTLTSDYRGTDVMSGFRPVPVLGGGCIVANLEYEAVLVPIHRLGLLFVLASLAFIVAGAALSLLLARAVTKPIARLANSARMLEAGDFAHPVPISGSSEIQQLGRALSSMAKSVGHLIEREHAARLEAETANRTKDDFLAMVSHELRTPLNAILGWVSILIDHQDDGAVVNRAARAVERNARTQTRLIEELLDVSRIVSGHLRLNVSSQVSLTAVVDAAIETVRPGADTKGLAIVRRFPDATPWLAADGGRLQQVVGNLLTNAVRFTPEGGRIDIAIRSAGEGWEIRVADNGAGIAPEFLPHVFDRFRQGEASTTRVSGGLGLGLAIARHLVELHGGTLTAESGGVGLGATFTVRLPFSMATAPEVAGFEPSMSPSVPPLLGGTRVLVVDDDEDTRDVLRAILEGAGAAVVAVSSAAETRDFLEQADADLLIADIGMPREDGYSLIRSVRRLQARDPIQLPAIALTAHARPEDVAAALESGFQIHIAKPVDASRLLSAVTSTLVRTWTN